MPYRNITIYQARGLRECKANASEITAYLLLTPDGAGAWSASGEWVEWFTSQDGGRKLSLKAFSQALRGLTRKEYTRPDGTRRPVLDRIAPGYRGHVATYRDNLADDWGEKVHESVYQSDRERYTNRGTKVHESGDPQYTRAATVKPSRPKLANKEELDEWEY